jgi:hypothetical protein
MNGKLSLALLCTAAIAFACGPRTRNSEVSNASTARTDVRSAAATRSTSDSPLAPSFDVDVADGVRFEFSVVNEGKKKLELNFADGRTHDVVVLDSLGKEVWRWSKGRIFTQAMQNKVLRTSDSLTYEESWKDAMPGRYVAVATLSSANFPVTQRVEFEVR